jgi:hypothetical protein
MKTLRILLIALAAPAAVLLGLHEIGGTSLSKGSETGFAWQASPARGQLILSAHEQGDVTAWLRLTLPASSGPLTAVIDTPVPVTLTVRPEDPQNQVIEITKTTAGDAFKWPAGRKVTIQFSQAPASLSVHDWEVHLSKAAPDSQSSARWRNVLFYVALFLLGLVLLGGFLEAMEKFNVKPEPFTSPRCVAQMIASYEGKDAKESEQFRTFLTKLLMEEVSLEEALAPLNLSRRDQVPFLAKVSRQFLQRLEKHVAYIERLAGRLPTIR